MTQEQAQDIIGKMKSGMGFSDEENDVFWSYTYDPEKNKFSYLEAWMVIGSPLDSRDYSEPEFTELLVANFDYQAVLSCAFSRGSEKPQALAAALDQPGVDDKEKITTAIKAGDLTALKKLLATQTTIDNLGIGKDQRTPLNLATENGYPEIVEYLISRGADVNRADSRGDTPMQLACDGHKPEAIGKIVSLLLEAHAKIPSHAKGHDGPLHYAAMYGSVEAVRLLVESGVDVNVHGGYGRTPLMYAAADAKSPEMVDFLIKSGADVNAVNEGGDNALFDAVTREDPSVEVATRLIEAGLDLNYVHPSYKTILCWAAYCGRKEIVELLLARGADVNAENNRNESPIAQAMMRGHHEIVKLLLAAGADPESKNYGGWTLLEYATEQKDKELVREIIERTAKKPKAPASQEKRNAKSESLTKAAEKGDVSMLKLLVDEGADVNGRSRWGDETALMKAAYYGMAKAVAWLIDHGANIEARDSRGNTALNHAAWMGKAEVISLLVARGADVNAVNNLNWNSLMQAALEGHVGSAKILLENGARTDFIDKEKGASAYYLAQRSGSQELIELMKKHGAEPRKFRQLAPGEAFVDIRSCEYCQYIPQRKDIANAESLGDYPGLVELHSVSTEVDRYATSTIEVYKCKLCGTYYQHDHYIDTEDSFVAGPTIHRHLQRFNFERLKMAFAEYKLHDEEKEFAARLPGLLASMKEALAREGAAIHPHFLPHFIENAADTYILAGDWQGLKSELLGHADKKLVLQVVDDLITIFGEGKYARKGGEQDYKAYRHITPGVYQGTRRLLAENRAEFKKAVKEIGKLSEHKQAAAKVMESIRYYKI